MTGTLYPHESPKFWMVVGILILFVPHTLLFIGGIHDGMELDSELFITAPVLWIVGFAIMSVAGDYMILNSNRSKTICPSCKRRLQ